jgi:mechanosensitive ion channel-like protein
MPTVTNWLEAVMVSIAAALMAVLSFLPALIGAIVILVIGWILSGLVANVVTRLLERVGFNHAAERTGVTTFIARTGAHDFTAARVVAELVKWFIRLIFLEAAAAAIHLNAVTDIINRIVLFIPNLIVALLVLMVGALVARFVGDLVRGSASEMGFGNPNMLASISRVAILAFAVIVAVNQVGIAAAIVNTLFMAIVFALALAVGLAFGLGGRDTAAQVWQRWYARGQEMAPRLEAAAQSASQPVEERVSQPAEGAPAYPERRRAADQGRLRPTSE